MPPYKIPFILIPATLLAFLAACAPARAAPPAANAPTAAAAEPTAALSQALPNLPQFVWRVNGDRDSFSSPGGMALDAQGNLYVWDGGHVSIQVFDFNGKLLRKWGGRGTDAGLFSTSGKHPYGSIAIDPKGNVYVPDYGNDRVQKFDSEGKFIAQWGKHGTGDGELTSPYGIAVDAGGRVYVIDDGTARVQVFDGDGRFLSKFGGRGTGDGQFQNPSYITVDGQGKIYVPDAETSRIQKFNPDGTLAAKWNAICGDGKPTNPNSIAVDGQGFGYVTDYAQARICKFDSQGHFLFAFGSRGVGNGELTEAAGIVLDAQGNLYVDGALPPFIQKFKQP